LRQELARRSDRGLYILAGRIDVAVRSNWMTTWVTPAALSESIWVTPKSGRTGVSSGEATDDAIVSALATARFAVT